MDRRDWIRLDRHRWQLNASGPMRVPVIACASEALLLEMDAMVRQQACQVAQLPGIAAPVLLMPDAHWGYGFPIGAVAAFDAERDGVVCAAGVGFDVACGVRALLTGLQRQQVLEQQRALADALFARIPAGLGSSGAIHLNDEALGAMLHGGAHWAVEQGWGYPEDLQRCELRGCSAGADPTAVSALARQRQRAEMGTLGSGNHYLEVQAVRELLAPDLAAALELEPDAVLVMLHCGSRGLGHQVASDFIRLMTQAASEHGLALPERDLAHAPICSPLGQRYLGAMRAAINCAFANRQILSQLVREAFASFWPQAQLRLLYDHCHNTCQEEDHLLGHDCRRLYVHRKGATRAFGPAHGDLPAPFSRTGQPVLVGGSMGTASYVLVGVDGNEALSLGSACHGAGRRMSRHQALRQWGGRQLREALAEQGITVRCASSRGLAEEAPGAYKDVEAVVEAAEAAGLARRVARLEPLICIKG
jgi:tRNA-splicing ligase RtcB (3'-phosphate/5'-hydroxy nucleic acid ligase)